MVHHYHNFITIPADSFSIFIGSRLFLSETLAYIPQKFSHQKVLYLHSGHSLFYLNPPEEEQKWIEFRIVLNPVDILSMVESDPARFMIIVYNPEWFKDYPEYVLPFGHLCRERSRRRQEVILISRVWDHTIEELESLADKVACVQDILTAPNNNKCACSQVTLSDSLPHEVISKVPVRKYGQQALGP